MNLDRTIFAFAGIMILASLALGNWGHPAWFLLTAFAGFNMFQAAFTGICPAAAVFNKLGIKAEHALK